MYRDGLLNLLHRKNAKYSHINRENEENVDNRLPKWFQAARYFVFISGAGDKELKWGG